MSIRLPSDPLVQLYTDQYGKPVRLSDQDFFGGSIERYIWTFSNGTSIEVVKRITHGWMEPRLPIPDAELNQSSSAEYRNPDLTKVLLGRTKGRMVDSKDN